MRKERRTPQSFEELTLKDGKFVDGHNKPVRVKILGVGMAKPKSLEQVFVGDNIPKGTNAFIKGHMFDMNIGSWRNFPRCVAPVLYLRKH